MTQEKKDKPEDLKNLGNTNVVIGTPTKALPKSKAKEEAEKAFFDSLPKGPAAPQRAEDTLDPVFGRLNQLDERIDQTNTALKSFFNRFKELEAYLKKRFPDYMQPVCKFCGARIASTTKGSCIKCGKNQDETRG